MDKLLNTSGSEELTNVNFDNFSVNNKLLITDKGFTNYLVAQEFTTKANDHITLIDSINSSFLTPINKFTRYFITIKTTDKGINIDNNIINNDVLQNITINFIFKNEDEEIVDDIEIIKMDNGPVNSSQIVIEHLNYENNYNGSSYTTPGNHVLIFRRKPIAGTERTYKQLKVYYNFTNISDSNFKNLPNTNQLLGAISYSNVGTASDNFSYLTVGNFRLAPSGDGKHLILTSYFFILEFYRRLC